jgi:hypothetical protein
MTILKRINECKNCLDTNSDVNSEFSKEYLYRAFLRNDNEEFDSAYCTYCGNGVIPDHLPEVQVIRYIKNIFEKYNIKI